MTGNRSDNVVIVPKVHQPKTITAARACWAGPLRSPGAGAGCADPHALLEAPTPPGGAGKRAGVRANRGDIYDTPTPPNFSPQQTAYNHPWLFSANRRQNAKISMRKYIRLRYINI